MTRHTLGPLSKDRIRLSGDSIFYTLQGEGPTIGMPALFMRLHECNLKCTWCDAYYTWDETSEEYWTEAHEVDVLELAETMSGHMYRTGCSRWVITGGEPMMQKHGLETLLSALWQMHGPHLKVEFETNGTILPTPWMLHNAAAHSFIQFNCSPKTSNSGNPEHKRKKLEVLKALSGANTYYKFVVASPDDVAEILEYTVALPQKRIVLMPEGTSVEELQKHMEICDLLCKKYGWRLSPRLQVHLYGNKRAT